MIYLAIPAAIAVAVIAADWLDWHGTLGPAWWLTLPARLVMPHTGHHRDKYATDAPAPHVRPGQESRSGDPRGPTRAVPAGATTGPGGAPVPPEAASEPAPPARAAAPQPHAAPPVAAEVSLGLGRHPFDDHRERQPWVIWHRPNGEQLVIGYGPTAEIPRPYAQARVTGAHVIVPGAAPLVSRRYAAHEAHVDKAANQ